MISKISLVSMLCLISSLSADLLQTLPFPVNQHALYRPSGRFFIGASTRSAKNDMAVALADRTDSAFRGITPERVILNSKANQLNPLNGAAIKHLALLDRRAVVIPDATPVSLFLIEDRSPIWIRQSAPLCDAHGAQVPFVLALTTTASQVAVPLDAGTPVGAIAAVPNADGGFDGNGSGIAFAVYRQVVNAQANLKFFTWDILDALTGASSYTKEGVATDTVYAARQNVQEKRGTSKLAWLGKYSSIVGAADPAQKRQGNKAAPFGKDTPELMIGVPAAAIAPAVDLHYDWELKRLYIATQVTAGDGLQAGARAVVAGSTANGHLQFQKIAPDSAFDGENRIVGKTAAGSITTMYKVRTMQTRTYLRYLIVVGGNGNDPLLKQSVFALPLVDNFDSAAHGSLAKVDALPVTIFQETPPYRFKARVYATPAQQPSDLYTMSSPQARVGGQASLPGPISDIDVSTEAVFVSCLSSNNLNQEQLAAGIFYSQPLFDVEGRISGWTDWQRVANSSLPVDGFGYDPLGTFWQIPQSTTNSTDILRSKWTDGTDELSTFIMRFVNKEKGGIQGLIDMPYTTSGFTTDVDERLSVQILMGYKKVILMQTGKQKNGLFTPFEDFNDVYVRTDGTIAGFKEASNLVISGGTLDTLGPISAAAVLSDGVTGWFVVGGVGGIAILADTEGHGWNAQQGLQSGFVGLSSSAEWKIISTTPFVRKLLVENGQLFALSQGKLERFAITADTLVKNSVSSVVLSELSVDQKNSAASYSDFHLQGPLAIMGTSFGLLRSGSGFDVRTGLSIPWIAVPLVESVGSLTNSGPVNRIFALKSSETAAQDNLYVLNGYVGLDQALIYRLVISLENGVVTDTSVQLFPDYFLKDTQSFFANIGEYRDYLVTDGALIALSRSSLDCFPPLLELLSPALKSGQLARLRAPFMTLPANAGTVGLLIRSSASGAWMVPGDFGVRIQR